MAVLKPFTLIFQTQIFNGSFKRGIQSYVMPRTQAQTHTCTCTLKDKGGWGEDFITSQTILFNLLVISSKFPIKN